MRLYELEAVDPQFREKVIKDIAKTILGNCSQYLKAIGFPKNSTNWLLRGESGSPSQKPIDTLTTPLTVRSDRRPRNTPLQVHQYVDEWLAGPAGGHFGWNPRSAGLFTVGRFSIAADYGVVHAVFPIGNFNYLWAEKINDMTVTMGEVYGALQSTSALKQLNIDDFADQIDKKLAAAKWHHNKGMGAYFTGFARNEMTIDVGSYYAIPIERYPHGVCLQDIIPYMGGTV